MNLDEQLSELLAGLDVVMEPSPVTVEDDDPDMSCANPDLENENDVTEDDALAREDTDPSELSLFQTSREHYGVFYRLDLIEGAPQLRVFLPDEDGPVKMRCYLVRAPQHSPLRSWFAATRGHDGSEAYDEARDVAQQHLLFAAGEVMKRLFWMAMPEGERFPAEVEVRRLV
jgi:hypothetical protein